MKIHRKVNLKPNRLIFLAAKLLVVIFCQYSFGQTPTPTPRAEDEEIRIDSRLVVVPVSVTDAQGNPVAGLRKEDFQVFEEGKKQTVQAVGAADVVPLEIAILFDISSSTGAMFKFEQQTAAQFLREVMKPIDRASVFSMGQAPVLVLPRDTREKAAQAILSLTPTKESTAFFDTVAEAANYLAKNAPAGSRKVILVISDGEDTNSAAIAKAIQSGINKSGSDFDRMSRENRYQFTVKLRNDAGNGERRRVAKSLQDSDTVFYSINPAGSSYLLNSISVFGQQNMELFANETGGSAYLPRFAPIDTSDALANASNSKKNSEVLANIFKSLANELQAQYLIQYYSDTEYPNGRFVKLDVRLTDPTRGRLRARQGYYVKN
ncbi:MAG TPA: VWA domain-containing protein [Pyrinomonadaceae bacterium]|jgi:Ca-activated chloride channel family protein|nr:VWA domain-containing protein [Pyrinomonadaceae bacterium]